MSNHKKIAIVFSLAVLGIISVLTLKLLNFNSPKVEAEASEKIEEKVTINNNDNEIKPIQEVAEEETPVVEEEAPVTEEEKPDEGEKTVTEEKELSEEKEELVEVNSKKTNVTANKKYLKSNEIKNKTKPVEAKDKIEEKVTKTTKKDDSVKTTEKKNIQNEVVKPDVIKSDNKTTEATINKPVGKTQTVTPKKTSTESSNQKDIAPVKNVEEPVNKPVTEKITTPIKEPVNKKDPVITTKIVAGEERKIPYETIQKHLIKGAKTRVAQEGINGLEQIFYKVTYTDGKETSRVRSHYQQLKKPVNKIIQTYVKIQDKKIGTREIEDKTQPIIKYINPKERWFVQEWNLDGTKKADGLHLFYSEQEAFKLYTSATDTKLYSWGTYEDEYDEEIIGYKKITEKYVIQEEKWAWE